MVKRLDHNGEPIEKPKKERKIEPISQWKTAPLTMFQNHFHFTSDKNNLNFWQRLCILFLSDRKPK